MLLRAERRGKTSLWVANLSRSACILSGRALEEGAMRTNFKFSGVVAGNDQLHRLLVAPPDARFAAVHEIAPNTVTVTITNPGPNRQVSIPQYAATIIGAANGYDPAGDCNGAFMSAKFQPNNNCYAYACNIATNTFAQPGRAHGNLITAGTLNGADVQGFAEQDGLQAVGQTMAQLRAFAAARAGRGETGGHYVALMIAAADGNWPGDYHWVRCDDDLNFASWSQKDGGDQVTNFDFGGRPITDPSIANWTVNQGPAEPPHDYSDLLIDYVFYSFMFVPPTGVTII